MNYDAKHRTDSSLRGAVPRRALLLGGILAAGASFGIQGMTGPSPERATAPATGNRASRDGRSSSARNARKASAAVPLIHPTARWGARKPDRKATTLPRPPKYVVVHHTFTNNVDDYSLEQANRIARAIQTAHRGRGWGDTGQQFTISRGGHILEGRTGSLAAAERGEMVLGTHVRGANSFAVGIECEGTYNTVLPPRRLRDSLVNLCAWLCVQYNLNPYEAIVPHMKFNDTDCCGYKFAPTLPTLRADVAKAVPSELLS